MEESVSNGKTLVANAITIKGVSTSTSASFSTMANNINSLKLAPYDFGNYLKGASTPITIESKSSTDFTASMAGKMITWYHPSSAKNTSNFKTATSNASNYSSLTVSYICLHSSDHAITITVKTASGSSVSVYSTTTTGGDGSKTVNISSLTGNAYIHVYSQSKGGRFYLSDLYLS